jgi:hypothetical protein
VPSPEALLLAAGALAAAVLVAVLLAALRPGRATAAAAALARGDFEGAQRAGADPGAPRAARFAAAVAAKHRLDLAAAARILDELLGEDPGDGEAWLERGLVAAYGGEVAASTAAFERAAALRGDLAEALALHRAWAAVRAGDPEAARRLFEEIEAPLETKLRDLGDRPGPGDAPFAEWFLHAAAVWRALGDEPRAAWAAAAGRRAAPGSRLGEAVYSAGTATAGRSGPGGASPS